MSKNNYNLLDEDQNIQQQPVNVLKQRDLENIYYMFDDLKKKWSDKCYEQDCIFGNDHQSVKAISVKLQDIKLRNDVKHLSVYATKEVIIDTNFTFKGGSLTVAAPLVKVPYKVKIDLSGKDGSSYGGTGHMKAENGEWHNSWFNCYVGVEKTGYITFNSNDKLGLASNMSADKSATNGRHGLDGESGGNSGNLTVITQKFDGLEFLEVDLKGGNGGNGQNGGDGGSFEQSLTNVSSYYLIAPTKRAGGDGGNGGNAGYGGDHGVAQIYEQTFLPKQLNLNNIYASNGKDGFPGEGGRGGNGWQPFNKLVLSRLKSLNEKISFEKGISGSNGDKGVVLDGVQHNEVDLPSKIAQDYLKFMKTYANVVYNDPKGFFEIVGQSVDFESFLNMESLNKSYNKEVKNFMYLVSQNNKIEECTNDFEIIEAGKDNN